MNPLTIKLPYPEDPDSFIRKYGKEKFNVILKQSQNVVEFYLSCLEKQYDCKTIEGKINISKIILPVINKVQSSLRKSEYIKILADALNTNEKVLMDEMSKKNKKSEYANKVNYKIPYPTEEEFILLSMIEDNILEEKDISEFQNNNLRDVAWELYSKIRQKKQLKPSSVLNLLSANTREILSQIMAKEFIPQNPPREVIQNWRKKNEEKKRIAEEIEKLQKLM